MSVIEMFWGLVITSLDLWLACQGGLQPWISWENVHVGFSEVWYFPTVVIPPTTLVWFYVIWFVVPVSGALFSVFFSFGEDAMKDYSKSLQWFRIMVLRIPPRTNYHRNVVELPSFSRYVHHTIHLLCFYVVTDWNRHRGPMNYSTLPPIPPQAVPKSPKSPSHISFYEMTSNCGDGSSAYSRADLPRYSYYVYRPGGGMDGRLIVWCTFFNCYDLSWFISPSLQLYHDSLVLRLHRYPFLRHDLFWHSWWIVMKYHDVMAMYIVTCLRE